MKKTSSDDDWRSFLSKALSELTYLFYGSKEVKMKEILYETYTKDI